MPKQKKAAAKPELKVKPKKLDRTPKNGKKTVHAKTKVDLFAQTDAKASNAKPVALKLPRPLKKAARACAKAQGLKLRAWIVELIKIQLAKESANKESANPAAKSLQTL